MRPTGAFGKARPRWAPVVVLAVVAAACAGSRTADEGAADGGPASTPAATGSGWIGEDGDLDWSSPGGPGAADAVSERALGGTAAAGGEPGAADTVAPGPVPPGAPLDPPESVAPPVDTRLNAGSVDDNERWEDYLLYRQDALASGLAVHDVDVAGRRILRVTDGSGRPVLGAQVEIRSGDDVVTRRSTFADGRMMFFAPAAGTGSQDPTPPLRARITKGDATTEVELSSDALAYDVTLDGAPAAPEPVPLDVLFLIDATGSMADEIEQLKANMVSVAEQVDALDPRPDVRFAMTVYRDQGDVFVTRTFDFTTDVDAFTAALREVVAAGGGDYPEALDQALHDALTQPAWRDGDAIRLVFLVADAPPHLGDGLDSTTVDYAADGIAAAERGVKIHPIAANEADDQAEYVMRQLAQLTFGRFNFLTYGADGRTPGESTSRHVDEYSVLSLDELVVQLVADEVAALRG